MDKEKMKKTCEMMLAHLCSAINQGQEMVRIVRESGGDVDNLAFDSFRNMQVRSIKDAANYMTGLVEYLAFPEPEKEIDFVVTYHRYQPNTDVITNKVEFSAFNKEHAKEQFDNTVAKHNTMGNFCSILDITKKN